MHRNAPLPDKKSALGVPIPFTYDSNTVRNLALLNLIVFVWRVVTYVRRYMYTAPYVKNLAKSCYSSHNMQ